MDAAGPATLDQLGDQFTSAELSEAIAKIRKQATVTGEQEESNDALLSITQANYQIPLPPGTNISEAVIFPYSDNVEAARFQLQSVPVHDRYYAQFVGSLAKEKYEEVNGAASENLVFPPVSLGALFGDRPKLKQIITSKSYSKDKKATLVEGPYTGDAYFVVTMRMAGAANLLKDEAWVVPLTPEEEGENIAVHLKRLAEDYQGRAHPAMGHVLRGPRGEEPDHGRRGTQDGRPAPHDRVSGAKTLAAPP